MRTIRQQHFWITSLLLLLIHVQFVNAQTPRIGFLDFVQDETVELAHKGFMDALRDSGYSEELGTLQVDYVNAQGDIPTLGQSCDLLLSKSPDLIAANLTLSTITAVKKTQAVPIFMMVAPHPDLAGLTDANGNAPANLSGVYETLDYIDTSVALIKTLLPDVKSIGTIYNQSEPQSRDAFAVLERQCKALDIELISLPVANSAEAQLVTEALLAKSPDAFFALPDNVIFAAFETINNSCAKHNVPVFTSEAGLVSRGAVASFGADFYLWGYQSGAMAAQYLKSSKTVLPPPEIVAVRKQWINEAALAKFKNGIVTASSNKSVNYYLTALLLGLALVPMSIGIFITLRIFNIPDITTDGSYTLGAAVTVVCLLAGWSPITTLLFVFGSGMLAGIATGEIHTRLKVHPLLAGILVMTALYSVNLMVMGRSNIPLDHQLGWFSNENMQWPVMLTFATVIAILVIRLLKTDFGLAMRATGNSEPMIRAMGVNTNGMKIAGLALANGLTTVSGYLVTQYQWYADINMGIGIVIAGLAAVIIGESLYKTTGTNSIVMMVLMVIAGSILFRVLLAFVLSLGLDPNYLKLVTALVVLVIVSLKSRSR